MSHFKTPTVTAAEVYNAAKEVCSRLYVAMGGNPAHTWQVNPHPSTAAIGRVGDTWMLYMPAMPLDARLSGKEADVLIGYVTHELGHALYTDFGCMEAATREGIGRILNGLEDVRIEAKLCDAGGTIGNARDLLETLTEYCTARDVMNGWKPEQPHAVAFTLYQYGAIKLLGYTVPSMPSFDAMPVELARVVEKAVRNVRRAKSTQDVLAIARWVKAELQGQAITLPPMQTQPGQGEGEGEGDGQGEAGEAGTGGEGEAPEAGTGQGEASEAGTAGTGQGEGKGEGESPEAPAAGTPTAGTEAGKDTGQGSPKGEPGGEGGERGGMGAWDVTDKAQRDPEADLSDLGDRVSERNGRKSGEVAQENSRVTEFLNVAECSLRPKGKMQADPRVTEAVAGKIPSPAKLRRDVTKAVRSPERTNVARHETKGRYDNRSSARAQAGAVNVFRRREEEPGREAAVSFLIDLSSSMSGKPIETAVALALHLGDALRAASVPFEVAGFTMPVSVNTGAPKAGLTVAKGFNDPWQDARPYVGALSYAPSGGTSMMPAIVGMVKRLRAKSGVTRRILLCLVDGGDAWSIESNRAAIRDAEAHGVEVVMIGCLEDVSAYGPRHVNVMSLRDVTTDGLGALVDVLEGRTPRHRQGLAPVA